MSHGQAARRHYSNRRRNAGTRRSSGSRNRLGLFAIVWPLPGAPHALPKSHAVTGIVSLAALPLLAQTEGGLFEGTAAFGDWRDRPPGTRRLIGPRDLPAPDLAQSVRDVVRIVRRTEQKPIVPNGFEVNLFASGLAGPRIVRTAPNGDVVVAESGSETATAPRRSRSSPWALLMASHRLLSATPDLALTKVPAGRRQCRRDGGPLGDAAVAQPGRPLLARLSGVRRAD